MSNLTSKRLRIVQKGYENYTGPLGEYEFVDGLSVELVPFSPRERLAAAFQMVEINDDGTENDASVAERILREKIIFADVVEPLVRQTDEEKALENVSAIIGNETLKPLYTSKAIEKAATEKGIAGVRIIAETWGVRSKSIPDLIGLIVKAQSEYVINRVSELVAKNVPEAEAKALFVALDEVPASAFDVTSTAAPRAPAVVAEPVVAEPVAEESAVEGEKQTEPDVNEAAASGDLGAALNVAE